MVSQAGQFTWAFVILPDLFILLISFFFSISTKKKPLDSIENGIEDAATDVESGRAELIKAAEYQAKYRRKVAILLLIAVIIGLIVTGIVVSQLRS